MLKRTKRRYLAVRIEASETLDSKDFTNALWNSIGKLYGEYGASKTGLALLDYDKNRGLAVMRVNLAALDIVRASIASIVSIGNKPAAAHVVLVSGTLSALRRKM